MKTFKNYNNINYLDKVNRINTKYANVANNSIVVFGDRHLKYLRPDIEIRNPYTSTNPDERESWSNLSNYFRCDIKERLIRSFIRTSSTRSRKIKSGNF